jgi:uncharacterized protein (TIGR00369 family)
MDHHVPDNPTRAQIANAVNSGQREFRLDANSALQSMDTVLVEGTPGDLLLRFTAPKYSIQGNGVVSGGMLANMLDLAMAAAVLSRLPPGRIPSTISMTVNMMASAQAGAILATTRVDRMGRSIAFANAELRDPHTRKLLANATSSLVLLDERATSTPNP